MSPEDEMLASTAKGLREAATWDRDAAAENEDHAAKIAERSRCQVADASAKDAAADAIDALLASRVGAVEENPNA